MKNLELEANMASKFKFPTTISQHKTIHQTKTRMKKKQIDQSNRQLKRNKLTIFFYNTGNTY